MGIGLGPMQKRPPMAGFCNLLGSLQTPNLTDYEAESSKVSGGSLKYSRFLETVTGDLVGSTLPDPACSVIGQVLCRGRPQIGNAESALPCRAWRVACRILHPRQSQLGIPSPRWRAYMVVICRTSGIQSLKLSVARQCSTVPCLQLVLSQALNRYLRVRREQIALAHSFLAARRFSLLLRVRLSLPS
jgi:hypothetical protein